MAQDASAPFGVSEFAPDFAAYRSNAPVIVHDEASFRHFLEIERRRAENASRSVLLVLVSLRSTLGRSQHLTPRVASAIFAALGSSVREVDFVGWWRDGHVAAAALIHRGRPPTAAIATRISDTLKRELHDEAVSVRLRVVTLAASAVSP